MDLASKQSTGHVYLVLYLTWPPDTSEILIRFAIILCHVC